MSPTTLANLVHYSHPHRLPSLRQKMDGPDPSPPPADLIKLNVGGKLFETTAATLLAAGPDSLLATLPTPTPTPFPIFIDRDPDLFSILLSLLRSRRLPSAALRFSTSDLLHEAYYFGVEPLLRSAMSPQPLLGADASLAATLLPAADGFATALSADTDGSVMIAHGGQISAYDWSLSQSITVRTHLNDITSIRAICPDIAAIGSVDSPGLHFYNLSNSCHAGSVHWSDPGDPRVYKARVSAIANVSQSGPLFAAFECQHRENCILEVDREEMRAVSVIGRQSGGAAKTAVAGRVVHVAERGLVFASAVSRGAFGYSGYMRLWDLRSGEVVWEACEPGGSGRFGDSFADADVDCGAEAIYKVCWKSGDLAVADMRRLRDNSWVYLSEPGAALRGQVGGEDSVVHCYKGQVFVGREGGLEAWSLLDGGGGGGDEGRVIDSGYRRDHVDTEEDAARGLIRKMEAGGDRLFLCREGMEGVEVWESSNLSGAISLL